MKTIVKSAWNRGGVALSKTFRGMGLLPMSCWSVAHGQDAPATGAIREIAWKSMFSPERYGVCSGLFAVILAATPAAWSQTATPIVSFDPSKVSAGKDGVPYLECQRNSDVSTSSEVRFNFDTAKPLFAEEPEFYGGLDITDSGTTLVPTPQGGWRLHTNNPPSWPNYPAVFFNGNDTSSQANYYNVTVLYVWKKAGFAGVKGVQTVKFNSSSTLGLSIKTWFTAGTEKAKPAEIRFVLRNGSRYYVSEAKFSFPQDGTLPPDTVFDLADFNNNPKPGKRWAAFEPTATSFGLPASFDWAAVDFNNVTEAGWIGQGSGVDFRLFGFSTFNAAAMAP